VRVSLFPSNYCLAGTFQVVYTDWIFLGSICLIGFGVVICIASYECHIGRLSKYLYIFLFIKN